MDISKGKAPLSGESEQSLSTKAKTGTFWTTCYKCKVRYEYSKIYLNQQLRCIKCEMPFEALETPPPSKLMDRAKQKEKKQPERKGRKNQREERKQFWMKIGKKAAISRLNRLKASSK